jgi:hypothetical protein
VYMHIFGVSSAAGGRPKAMVRCDPPRLRAGRAGKPVAVGVVYLGV